MHSDLKELQQMLGLVGYYRKFIRGFSLIAKPLLSLLRKDQRFEWTDDCQHAFRSEGASADARACRLLPKVHPWIQSDRQAASLPPTQGPAIRVDGRLSACIQI